MIYKLEFDKLSEYSSIRTNSGNMLMEIHKILGDALLLYRYKTQISNPLKQQVNNSSKIKYNLIKENSIVILHLDIYEKNIESVRETIEWCLNTNRDLFIPIQKYNYTGGYKIRQDISDIVREYEGETYSMNLGLKQLKRDLIIGSL